ncbi:MAG: kelch repeat-containing protein [Chloroflexota bacterium]
MKHLAFTLMILSTLIAMTLPAAAGAPDGEIQARGWREYFPPVSPPARTSHAMAYDTARGVAVLFGGGSGSYEDLDDTWEWDSRTRTWNQRFPAHHPSGRWGHAMAYDEARGVTVLFGGTVNFGGSNETWIWDGSDWTQLFPDTVPEDRYVHGMAYDSDRQVTVMFGGLYAYDDTWEWDGLNWSQPAVANPNWRIGQAMVYDRPRHTMVIFAGDDTSGWYSYFDDTWERTNGGDWVEISPPQRPPMRERMAAAYFADIQRTVVFGGLDPWTRRDDTWIWDGVNWRTRTFEPRPWGRCCTAMVYDPILHGLVLFGGATFYGVETNDTWLFR